MMNRKFEIIVFLVLMINSGCAFFSTKNPLASSSQSPTVPRKNQILPTIPSSTPILLATPTVIPTENAPILLPSPISTSTIQPTNPYYNECTGRGLLQEPSSAFEFPGVLAYYDNEQEKIVFTGRKNSHLWESQKFEEVPELVGFSPNGEWFAYTTLPAKFHLLSYKGELIENESKPKELLNYFPNLTGVGDMNWFKWVNDQLISIGLGKSPGERFMAFYNPFSGEWALPDIYNLDGFNKYGRSIPSPDLTRELHIEPGSTAGSNTLVLWDRDNQVRLWQRYNFSDRAIIEGSPNDKIEWSLDSSKVAIIGENIVIISKDGKELDRLKPSIKGTPHKLRWSPDGKFLAFSWSEAKEVEPSHYEIFSSILIYDNELEEIIFTCPISNHLEVENLVWIDDEQMLAYHAVENGVAGPIVALDLKSGVSTKVAENTTQFGGWSSRFTIP